MQTYYSTHPVEMGGSYYGPAPGQPPPYAFWASQGMNMPTSIAPVANSLPPMNPGSQVAGDSEESEAEPSETAKPNSGIPSASPKTKLNGSRKKQSGANKRRHDDSDETQALALPPPRPSVPQMTTPHHSMAVMPHAMYWAGQPAPHMPYPTMAPHPHQMMAHPNPAIPQMMVAKNDDKEVKRQRRKQSNRESARRSRMRKQAECEGLNKNMETLTKENQVLRNEIDRLNVACTLLTEHKSQLEDQLKSLKDSTS